MDNLTHGLVGALIGQAGLKRRTGLAMPALVIGANLPDADATCFLWVEGVEHLAIRRGITHGPVAWVLLPLILAALLAAFDRWQTRRGTRPEARLPVSFGWLYALSLIACLTHPALDWLNVYGIRLLEPFSSRWFYGDTLFIIDIWLWIGLGLATWLSRRQEKHGGNWRGPARIALAGALAYIGGNYAISQADRMLETSLPDTIASPQPIAFWRRDTIGIAGDGRYYRDGKLLGDLPLDACDLDAAREASSQVDAFLFWSRAPVLRISDGGILLGDARYDDPRSGGRFSVPIPRSLCRPAAIR